MTMHYMALPVYLCHTTFQFGFKTYRHSPKGDSQVTTKDRYTVYVYNIES